MSGSDDLPLSEIKKALPEYRFDGTHASGGQGSVYKVCSPSGEAMALKIFRAGSLALAKRVERSIEAHRDIDSPVLVKCKGHGEISNKGKTHLYVLTDFIEGEALRTRLSRGALGISETRDLIGRICLGIDALWAREIVHRDIKPENILLDRLGKAWLVDLDYAKHVQRSGLTAFGAVPGTDGYKSPEQADGQKNLTRHSDIFSLGIVAYEAASNTHPFGFDQELIGENLPAPLASHGISDRELCSVVDRMLAMHPADRPRSGAEIRIHLGIS